MPGWGVCIKAVLLANQQAKLIITHILRSNSGSNKKKQSAIVSACTIK
jgi:hypothetical protein